MRGFKQVLMEKIPPHFSQTYTREPESAAASSEDI